MQIRRRTSNLNKEFELTILQDSQTPTTQIPITPLLKRIYLARGISNESELKRAASQLHSPHLLNGIDIAVSRLVEAIKMDKHITIVGDFDADGATSTVLSLLALSSMGAKKLSYLIPSRFADGYGLSPSLVQTAKQQGTNLILTVDNGISAFAGVNAALEAGIEVIVTDHHLPGDSLPEADAIVNPNLSNCAFPSKNLAGVGVAFYVMLALRAKLRNENWFAAQQINEPNLADLLDLVAVGTVADVVPLDANNRILVYQGLQRIRSGKCRVGITALLSVANKLPNRLSATDLGFVVGPRLNAAGRLDDMSIGVELLLSTDPNQAKALALELDALNLTRKEIEQGMQLEALKICDEISQQNTAFPFGIALYHKEWHQGVVGLLASRIKERFHRPVFAFAPADDGTLKGSGRSITGVHLRDLLERMHSKHPNLLQKFGGHAMAAGVSIQVGDFEQFQTSFAELVEEWVEPDALQGIIWSDGMLEFEELTLTTAQLIREAGPWGQAFPEPIFDGKFRLLQQRLVGEKHLKMTLEPIEEAELSDLSSKRGISSRPLIDAIAFNVDTQIWPDASIKIVELAYKLDVNFYRGEENLQLLVECVKPI